MTINECIEKLEAYTKEVEEKAKVQMNKLDPEMSKQVEALAQKTNDTIKKSIDKLDDLKKTVSDEATVNDFLTKLDAKCGEIVDYTSKKIDEFKPKAESSLDDFINNLDKETKDTRESLKSQAEKTYKDVEFKLNDSYNRFLNNSTVQSASKMVKKGIDSAVDFYNSDETQEFINTMKIKTIDLAEKGLDGLKTILDRSDDKKEETETKTEDNTNEGK